MSDDISRWRISLFNFPPTMELYKQMLYHGIPAIELEINFWADYPNSPPFVRVVHPILKPFLSGGGYANYI